MKSKILVIDGEGKRAHQFSYCLGQSGKYEIFAFIHQSASDNLKYSKYVSKVITHNADGEDFLNLILATTKAHTIDMVFGLSIPAIDFLIHHQSIISKHVKVQLLPTQPVFDLTNDKEQLALFLHQHHLNCPLTWSADAYEKHADEISFPILLKPKRGEGGKGIFKCNNHKEFEIQLKDLDASEYLIQNYIVGYDIDCSILAKDGVILCHTIQRGVEESKYNAFAPCSVIEFLEAPELYALVASFINKIKFTGIGHLDLRYDEEKKEFVIIEINNRYWDTLIGSLLVGKINFPFYHAYYSQINQPHKIPAFKPGVFLTATAYFRHKKNNLKIPFDEQMIHFKNSGAYVQLTDPMYFTMGYLKRIK